MHRQNVLCLVIDRLRASACGAYGNTWCPTRNFDRLASKSVTWDNALVDTVDLELLYRAYWQGLHALRPNNLGVHRLSLARVLGQQGLNTTLITDEPIVAHHQLAGDFAHCICWQNVTKTAVAHAVDHTELAYFFLRVVEQVEKTRRHHGGTPFFLWCHTRGMAGAWDAPLGLRNALVEPGDPAAFPGTQWPCQTHGEDHDPDEVLSFSCAYAGQVMLLDECIGNLIGHFKQEGLLDDTLLVLLGARGFPLGEHFQLGPHRPLLYNETIHVPWLMSFPNGMGSSTRSPTLVQPADLPSTLLAHLRVNSPWRLVDGGNLMDQINTDLVQFRELVCLTATDQYAIRTPAWYLRLPRAEPVELFAKPDDHWEVNEVSHQRGDVIAGLQRAAFEFKESMRLGNPSHPTHLDQTLVRGPH